MKIGLYFGSFNPIHIGHVHIAREVKSQFALDEVWLMVSPQNPFKDSHHLAPEQDRLAMARLACAHDEHIHVSDFDFSLPRPSYTINTAQKLRLQFPHHSFYLIMGEDNIHSFHQWKNVNELLQLVEVIIYPRLSNHNRLPMELSKYTHRFHWLSGKLIPVSATSIREQLHAGIQPYETLHPDVLTYIHKRHLYSS